MNNEIDMQLLGPGWWMKIHRDAMKATTEERKRVFEYNIEEDCNTFPCGKCKIHLRKFLDTHPLKKYWQVYDIKGRDIGFFKWTWELHNQVNRFLEKYQPTLEEAYDYYVDSGANTCFDCGTKAHINKAVETHQNAESRTLPIPSILTTYLETKQIQQHITRIPDRNNYRNIVTKIK